WRQSCAAASSVFSLPVRARGSYCWRFSLSSFADLDYRDAYRNKSCLITGGMGFIGSNLAHGLVALGARVLIVDSMIPDHGGNLFNIAGIEDKVHINIADIRTES